MDNEAALIAVVSYAVFLFSVVCHEAAHALAARLGGDMTAYANGQVTLNPIPHIRQEPFGLGILPLITMAVAMANGGIGVIGFASAPFDPYWAIRYPRRAAWMALAGPGANVALAAAAIFGLKIGLWTGAFTAAGSTKAWQLVHPATVSAEPFAVLLSILLFENLLLAIWNLLPIPPMDGFSSLLFFTPTIKTETFFRLRGQLGMIYPCMMLVVSSFFWEVFSPIYGAVVGTFLV